MSNATYILANPLRNGDVGRPCEFKDGNYKCKALAFQLSSSDVKIGNSLTHIQPYNRTIRYKCGNGHRFDKTFKIDKDLLAPSQHQLGGEG